VPISWAMPDRALESTESAIGSSELTSAAP
jgi:hypothetical protein